VSYLLSIVTINLNNVSGLYNTLQSVKSLKKDFIEYIIIDGGSSDGSVDLILQNFDFVDHYVSEPDAGIYAAMNKGIKMSRGNFVHLLNSGDIYADIDMSLLSSCLSLNFDFISFSVIKMIKNNWVVRHSRPNYSENFINCAHPGLIVKSDVYISELYNENFKIVSDNLFIYRKTTPWNTIIIPKALVVMSAGGVSQGMTPFKHEKERFMMLWKYDYRRKYRIVLQLNFIFRFLYSHVKFK
jgi:glycosyltransferase involved in cell wall biosynthesis